MQFTVPKFIDREPKIVGPFTFKQFLFVAIAVGIILIIWFILPKPLFFVASTCLLGTSLALAFLKPGGRSLPVVLKNFFLFSIGAKIYLWKKSGFPPKMIKDDAPKEEKRIEKTASSRIAEKSLLKKLSAKVETKK